MPERTSGSWDCEVVVVGAGPAGSAVATHLARLGHEVLLLEKWKAVREKTCGEYLSPDCCCLLDRLGVTEDLERMDPKRLRGMRIHSQRGSLLVGDFPGIPPEDPIREGPESGLRSWPGGISLPRTLLDGTLVRNAERNGAGILRGARVFELVREGRKVTGVIASVNGRQQRFRCPLVIGADGRNSIVAQRLDLRRPHRRLRRTGFILRYEGAQGLGNYGEVLLSNDSYCILNPLGGDRLTLGLVVDTQDLVARKGRLKEFLRDRIDAFPLARESIRNAHQVSRIRGISPLAFETSHQAGDGVLLVGDAAGFYDPLTGEGVHIALRGAELAAGVAHEALLRGDFSTEFLTRYELLRRRIFHPKKRFCAFLQAVIRRRHLVDSLAAYLNRRASLRKVFMGVIGDTVSPSALLHPMILLGLRG